MRLSPRLCLFAILLCLFALAGCNLPTPSAADSPVEAPAVTIQPTPALDTRPAGTPAPIYALSGGEEIGLPAGQCMDLESGLVLDRSDPRCDFTVIAGQNPADSTRDFVPLSYASFDFSDVFWQMPDWQSCSLLENYSSAQTRISLEGGYYICYQSGEGYWGILNIRALSEEELRIYWITYLEQSDLLADEPASFAAWQQTQSAPTPSPTPRPEKTQNQGDNLWVGVDYGLDLDGGVILPAWSGAEDLVVAGGEVDADGRLLSLQLLTVGNALIQGGAGFTSAPRSADCSRWDAWQSGALLLAETRSYRCVQTADGRLGYIFVHESQPGVGVRLTWATWPDVLAAPAPSAAAPTPQSAAAVTVSAPPQLGGVKAYRPGIQVSFSWQLKNPGTVAWNTRYALVLAGGTAMGGPEKKWIPYRIEPGMIVRLAFTLTIPEEPGAYTALYWLQDDSGNLIGAGPNGSQPLQLIVNSGEAGITLADGLSVQLPAQTCFDLDLGYPALNDEACDFTVEPAADGRMAQIVSAQTAFDFNTLFSTPPNLGQCQYAQLTSGRRVLDVQNWYVCFKTAKGRYGWLKILDTSPEGLLFDWKTYR
jgi:hypothetical protein